MKALEKKMIAFGQKRADVTAVEAWDTRFGKSVRVVKRVKTGQFVTNVTAKQLAKPL